MITCSSTPKNWEPTRLSVSDMTLQRSSARVLRPKCCAMAQQSLFGNCEPFKIGLSRSQTFLDSPFHPPYIPGTYMFEAINAQLTPVAEKLTHLRRFL